VKLPTPFAEHVLVNASRFREHAAPEHKRRLQTAYFPDGYWGGCATWMRCGK